MYSTKEEKRRKKEYLHRSSPINWGVKRRGKVQ